MPNKTIWKYPLEIADEQTLRLPRGARILSVLEQEDNVLLYAHVDPEGRDGPFDYVRVLVFGTGNYAEITDGMRFLGTVSTHGGRLVWHVFVEDADHV